MLPAPQMELWRRVASTGKAVVVVLTGGSPMRKLVGLKRVLPPAGEAKLLEVPVTNWALRSWNETADKYEVRDHAYTLEVGPYSGKIATAVKLTGQDAR
ncbi:MAG: fibronectin type III-like domain-contianing protein [Fimbriimonadaceae bacterium]